MFSYGANINPYTLNRRVMRERRTPSPGPRDAGRRRHARRRGVGGGGGRRRGGDARRVPRRRTRGAARDRAGDHRRARRAPVEDAVGRAVHEAEGGGRGCSRRRRARPSRGTDERARNAARTPPNDRVALGRRRPVTADYNDALERGGVLRRRNQGRRGRRRLSPAARAAANKSLVAGGDGGWDGWCDGARVETRGDFGRGRRGRRGRDRRGNGAQVLKGRPLERQAAPRRLRRGLALLARWGGVLERAWAARAPARRCRDGV